MRLLYIHKNYPAQFGHIASHLAEHYGFQCTFVSELPDAMIDGVRRIQYRVKGGAAPNTHFCACTFENYIWHSHAVYETLKQHPEVKPDLIVGHSGFGSTAFLADLFNCPILNYFEYYYQACGADLDFRPDQTPTELEILRSRSRNAMLLLDLQTCTLGYSPLKWQRDRFPVEYRDKIDVIFDGIDTSLWCPRYPKGGRPRRICGHTIPSDTRIVTYVSRGFESMRGFDIFMEAAKLICEARKDVVFLCVGSDRICYGGDHKRTNGVSFREYVISKGGYDLNRFIFTGRVKPDTLAKILSLSDLHIYLTVPFVLSWSLLNALACGCVVLASNTGPVTEIITEGENGLLTDFFDVEAIAMRALEVIADPLKFRSLRRRAIEGIHQEYSIDKTIPRMLHLYERAIATHAHRRNVSKREQNSAVDPLFSDVVKRPSMAGAVGPSRRSVSRPQRETGATQLPRLVASRVAVVDKPLILEFGVLPARMARVFIDANQSARVVSFALSEGGSCSGADREMVNLPECGNYSVFQRFNVDEALEDLQAASVVPDIVWVDLAHDYSEARKQLRSIWQHFPTALVCGSGARWNDTFRALADEGQEMMQHVTAIGNIWALASQ